MGKEIRAQIAEQLEGSHLELAFATQIAQCKLPKPERNFRIVPTRRWTWDFAWPDFRIAVEIQGGVWNRGKHGRGKGIINDMDKLNAAALTNWRVFQFANTHIQSGDAALIISKAIKEEKK